MRRFPTLAVLVTLLLPAVSTLGEESALPPAEGLAVWLDAAASETMTLEDGAGTAWRSRHPAGLTATASPGSAGPRFTAEALGAALPGVTFAGDSWLELPAPAESRGPLTVFIVFQRDDSQAGGSRWQRLLSGYDGVSENDTQGASVFLDTRGTAEPMAARVIVGSFGRAQRGPLTIGRNQKSHNEQLHGHIAEVLIYDRGFLVNEQYERIEDYLAQKWGVVDDPRDDWTLHGPLPTPPARVTDDLPLSDQDNAGGWKLQRRFSDEFESNQLDPKKWYDHNPHWYGRKPALFLPSNVEVRDGELHLTMRHDPTLPQVTKYGNSRYENFSSASVVSQDYRLYGYFEIESRAMDSAGSSAWWFSSKLFDRQGRASRTEIDVFEIGGKAEGHENKYHMNAHIFETPEAGENKWNRGGTWKAPFNFADGYHVFGLEWTPDVIAYYVDGVLVRRMPNTHWHTPVKMLFDSETMTDWLGWPDPADLPSTFSVRYVRAWKNKATGVSNAEIKKWRPEHTGTTEITEFVREYEKQLGAR